MNNYKVSKIGLLNFWLYDEEEFDFYDGKLILRGTNGSGKSVTMQSFIPLILDGNKNPDRLDPFGSKERKIEDYILGDRDSIQKDEAISYLYMETYNKEEDKYITIGLGFRGQKGKGVESWGFALKDGKRIRKDFYLYKDPVNKLPLTKKELKSRLGEYNEFTEKVSDYKSMVNRLLFGFPTIDQYDEFIKLLLQLRSNKLSKDYKPTNLVTVLNTVLKPLSEEDLRPLSEAIEEMNKTKEKVSTLTKNSKSLKDFLKVYNNYNEALLVSKARKASIYENNYNKAKKDYEDLENELNSLKEEYKSKTKRFTEVTNEIKIKEENVNKLNSDEYKNKILSMDKLKNSINELQNKISRIKEELEKYESDTLKLKKDISSNEEETYLIQKEIDSLLIDLKDYASDIYFDELHYFIEEINSKTNNSETKGIELSIKNYKKELQEILELLDMEDSILSKSENLRINLEKLKTHYNQLEKEIDNYNNKVKDAVLSWEEDFIDNDNKNTYLKLDEFTKKEIFNLMNNYNESNYEQSKKIYVDFGKKIITNIVKNNLVLDNKKELLKIDLINKEKEYNDINSKDDYILIDDYKMEDVLKENNISFVPLYKVIEFKENIEENTKNKIESVLLNSKILSAKIIDEKDIKKVENLNIEVDYLIKTKYKKNNILKYFNIVLDENSHFTSDYIKDILSSISIDNNDDVSIDEKGYIKLDYLTIKNDNDYKSAYIGYLKRIEVKKQKLIALQEEIDVIKGKINDINEEIYENEEKINLIEEEINKFPSNAKIKELFSLIKEKELELDYNDKNQKDIEKELKEYDDKIKEIKSKISLKNELIKVPLNIIAFKEVLKTIDTVLENIYKLNGLLQKRLDKLYFNSHLKERLEEKYSEIEYKKADLNEKETECASNVEQYKTLEELLENSGYKEVQEKISKLYDEIDLLKKEKEKLLSENAKLETNINNKEEMLLNSKEELNSKEKIMSAYSEIFIREYKLNYVYQEEITDKTLKTIINNYKDKKEVSLGELFSNFYSSFSKYKLELNDYSLKDITIFNDNETNDEDLQKIYNYATRSDITTMHHGIKMNVIELSKKLEEEIEECKVLIDAQDRHLFEEILLNTVGEKIRNRINTSYKWVEKINNIMSKMQDNSALRFKLAWKTSQATTPEELDTKELVEILKMDPKNLKEIDKKKVTDHFKSKIKKAEDLYEESYISFYKIIEEVLDYRSWFTFELFYQRKGENFKELTDKTFSKFSGGERAKSMYIPLFASVYAKLNLARNNSLRIIALDEAFAGVDEDNIREMFGILKYLDLDFIINSQVLWGDYDTINDLSICELIRPQNSSVVTIERYRWNGKYKEIITNRNENGVNNE